MSKPLTIYDLYLTSKEKEKDGIIIRIPPSEFVVARAGGSNKLFVEARDKYLKIFTNDDPDSSVEFLAHIWADSVIKDWKNVQDEEGNELKCTRDNIMKVLTDLPDLFDRIRTLSRDYNQFRVHVIEEAQKN